MPDWLASLSAHAKMFLSCARCRPAGSEKAANGSEMLIAQAAAAFERWTGVGGMADVMRAAVQPLLDDMTVRA